MKVSSLTQRCTVCSKKTTGHSVILGVSACLPRGKQHEQHEQHEQDEQGLLACCGTAGHDGSCSEGQRRCGVHAAEGLAMCCEGMPDLTSMRLGLPACQRPRVAR
jgi:hypothetical protein